jgi:large subunit ribosomal protein L28e
MSQLHSSDLQWQLIRSNHAFLVKRGGVTLSGEPGNLTGKHAFKFSGLANAQTVDVNAGSDGKITLSTRKNGAKAQRTLTAVNSSVLARNMRHHRSHGAKAIEAATTRSFYRRDLAKFAVARFHALNKAKSVKKVSQKLTRRQSASIKKRSETAKAKAKAA